MQENNDKKTPFIRFLSKKLKLEKLSYMEILNKLANDEDFREKAKKILEEFENQ